MGASDWKYFVPYETDTNAALQKLRQQVFERGEYLKVDYGDDWRNMTEDEAIEAFFDESDPELSEIVIDDWRAIKELTEPTSPESLLEWNRESGTHSIIDIYRGVSEQPQSGTISPLTSEQLKTFFGTLKPNHEMVANWLTSFDITEIRDRWDGVYITIYDGDIPTEYCFAGFSGD